MPGRAVIVGGGIGGLATAISLRRAGWEVEVLERAPALAEVGAGIALWANGLQALDRLGVGERVRAAARRHDGGAIRNAAGDTLMVLSEPDTSAADEWLGGMIHRADLLAALADAAGAVRTGAEVVGVAPSGDAVVTTLADGSTVESDVAVGADGIRSAVRRSILGDVPLRYAGYTVWRWVADFPSERLLAGETWGPGARFGQAALADGRAYVYATCDAPPGQHGAQGELPLLRERFASWHAPIPDLVNAAAEAEILRNDCFDIRPLRAWGRGRVTLVGDAAHAMTPNLGQGANQALEDAVVLGRCLARERDPERALRGYEAERRPRAARFQRRSWSAGALGQWSHPAAVRLREMLARRVLSRLQGRAMRTMQRVEL